MSALSFIGVVAVTILAGWLGSEVSPVDEHRELKCVACLLLVFVVVLAIFGGDQ